MMRKINFLIYKLLYYVYLIIPATRLDRFFLKFDEYKSSNLAEIRFEYSRKYKCDSCASDIFTNIIVNKITSRAGCTDSITVIDYGGGFGQGYWKFRGCIDKEIKIKYIVIETKSVIDVISKNKNSFLIDSGDVLDWQLSNYILGKFDKNNLDENLILYSDGCIQYLENLDDQFLIMIDILRPQLIAVARTPLSILNNATFKSTQVSLLTGHLNGKNRSAEFKEKFVLNPILIHSLPIFIGAMKLKNYNLRHINKISSRTFQRYGRNVKLTDLIFCGDEF